MRTHVAEKGIGVLQSPETGKQPAIGFGKPDCFLRVVISRFAQPLGLQKEHLGRTLALHQARVSLSVAVSPPHEELPQPGIETGHLPKKLLTLFRKKTWKLAVGPTHGQFPDS